LLSASAKSFDIPQMMKDFAEAVSKLPSWAEICRQRDEAAQKLRAEKK